MDIAILVMGTKNNPSTRNIEAFKNTVVDYCVKHKDDLQHNYKFVFYYADSLVESISVTSNETSTSFDILIPITESVHRTFEKTRTSLLVTRDIIKPDLYIRTNISTYINIPLLDKVAEQLNKDDVVFCNKIGTHLNLSSLYFNKVFPRGDLMIFNKSVVDVIDVFGKRYMYSDIDGPVTGVDHVDDCLISVCLRDVYGSSYHKHIQMIKYNYLPESEPDYDKLNVMCIGTRLKTVPCGMHSGYSWNDNDYRLFDVIKFQNVHNIVMEYDYSNGVVLDDLVVENVYEYYVVRVAKLGSDDYDNIQ